MANTFTRNPITSGDQGVWGPYVLAQFNAGLGIMTCPIYNDAGALKIGKGFIGIDNDSYKGIIEVDTVTTITLNTNNAEWGIIEVAVSGTTVAFSCTNTGKTSADTLPTDLISNWDPEKIGYYEDPTKRALGAAWPNTGGTLEGIISCKSNVEGYIGYCQSDDGDDYPYRWIYEKQSEDVYYYEETGENANGSWTKWGRSGEKIMECRVASSVIQASGTSGNVFTGDATLTFPKTFNSAPDLPNIVAGGKCYGSDKSWFGGCDNITTSQIRVYLISSLLNNSGYINVVARSDWA